jgi:hypothetical protein
LVGRCIYERLGSVYTPQTHDDAVAMLRDRRLAPLPVTGALKVALFWSQGGRPIANFGGSRREGFSFCGHQINRTRMERLRYVAFKFLEKHVMGDWLNYRLGVTRQRLAEQRKQCAT